MKFNNIFSSLMVAAAMVGFVACDDVKEDDRYIDMGEITAERNVLLVDFTGQMCLNCPDAHEVIEELEHQYNSDGRDHVIAVAVHCGLGTDTWLTDFPSGYVGLMTDEGNDLMQAFGIKAQPRGIVDLTGSSLDFPDWAGAVRTALEKSSHMQLTAKAVFTPAADKYGDEDGISGNINISMNILSGEADANTKVQFWIVENGIVAQQKFPDGHIQNDYVHNNVFRAQVFAGNGQDITLVEDGTVTAEGSIQARFSDTERWMLRNLSVVAFVTGDNGVIQVIRVPVTVPDDYQQPEA